jgi:EF hand
MNKCLASCAALALAFMGPPTLLSAAEPGKIEVALVDNWQFFAQGDADKDGHWSNVEFFQHPGYAETDFDLRIKTFIFWMIDDDKDNRISLQEWFNNELGQFQLGDSNHDGILSVDEAARLAKIEEKLFADLAVN